jgi:hypothetical protein
MLRYMNHRKEVRIPKTRSHAIWALEPNGDVLVFVHGFRGHPLTTWAGFIGFLVTHSRCKQADIVFYGHDGGRCNVHQGALRLHKFLNKLLSPPYEYQQATLSPFPQRNATFAYKKLVIVAHSLGAVHARLAFLRPPRSERIPWPVDLQLFLYAPAHCGAIVQELIRDGFRILGNIGGFIHARIRNRYQAIDDLEKTSKVLGELRGFQEDALQESAHHRYRARKVVWAGDERVVFNNFFPGDPDPDEIDGTDHRSVCKPTWHCPEAADLLLSAL